jgi:hypothetical protein
MVNWNFIKQVSKGKCVHKQLLTYIDRSNYIQKGCAGAHYIQALLLIVRDLHGTSAIDSNKFYNFKLNYLCVVKPSKFANHNKDNENVQHK